PDEARLLPALRRRDGAHAPLRRHPRARRGRLYERLVRPGPPHVDGDRPRRAHVGRGLVPRLRLAAVRPDAGPRDPLVALLGLVAAACGRGLADYPADQGMQVPSSSTLAELAGVAAGLGARVEPFVDAVDAARFGPPEGARAAARRARRELRRVERELRINLTRFERARGLLSLRSLGFS